MASVNMTVIALIPKVAEPVQMQQLWPISLCMVVYKIISKTLLNHLKPFLQDCISENQSAFLKGHLTFDNILIARELIHYLASSKNRSNIGVTIKLGMEKAFDRVEWSGPSFGEVSRLKEVLCIFADSLGQRINFDNSTIFYSLNTSINQRQRLSSILHIAEVSNPSVYLGVPLKVGKNKTNSFSYVNEMVDERIGDWTKQLLSYGVLVEREAERVGLATLGLGQDFYTKNASGLGLQDLRSFNLALLGKQLWRFITMPDSLVVRVFRAEYFLTKCLLDAPLSDHASFAWKGLHAAMRELRSGFYWIMRCNSQAFATLEGYQAASTLPKVHIFDWRLMHDYLADCKDVVEALRLGGFSDVISSTTTSAFDWLLKTVGSLSHCDFAKLLLLLWNLWNRRNHWVHDSQLQQVWTSVTTMALLRDDFLADTDSSMRSTSISVLSDNSDSGEKVFVLVWPCLSVVVEPSSKFFAVVEGHLAMAGCVVVVPALLSWSLSPLQATWSPPPSGFGNPSSQS
ncbi:hypothetical protein GQ457_12G016510 [Hibiscus cannabinus]